jgi:uncharacterized membrane protein YdjX (TVP38/TMEM64 family)
MNGAPPGLFDQLWFYFLYLFVDALLFPLASTVYVAYMGQKHAPLLVAVLGALGTAGGSVVQYLGVRALLRRSDRLPGWLRRWKERIETTVQTSSHATFWALFVIYATPLGAGPLRLIAAAGGYPLWRFALAIGLGCLPYYFALAWFGHAVKLPTWVYVAAALAILGLALAQWLARRARPKEPHA